MPYKDPEKARQYQRDRQAARPKKGKPKHWHVLSDVNEDARTATCSRCGPTKLRNAGGKLRCTIAALAVARKAMLKREYGITPEQFEQAMIEQEGRCKICKDDLLEAAYPAIDHDHATNKFRGLLCLHCNTGLGQFKDSIKLLLAAVAYLEDSRA